MVRGFPGRNSSYRPEMRRLMNRRRHLPTVALVVSKRCAIRLLAIPSAHAKTILARCTSAADIERERAMDSTALVLRRSATAADSLEASRHLLCKDVAEYQ